METYFEYKNRKVEDFKDESFAKYQITNSNRCFDDLPSAILYCIGLEEGNMNDSQLMNQVDTFMTMIRKYKS